MSEMKAVKVSPETLDLLRKLQKDDNSFDQLIKRLAQEALDREAAEEAREAAVEEKRAELRQKILDSDSTDSDGSQEPETDVEEARQSVRDRLDLPRGGD